MTNPIEQHQFDLFYVPHNDFEGNSYKNILTGVDITSQYNATRALRTKKASETAFVCEATY